MGRLLEIGPPAKTRDQGRVRTADNRNQNNHSANRLSLPSMASGQVQYPNGYYLFHFKYPNNCRGGKNKPRFVNRESPWVYEALWTFIRLWRDKWHIRSYVPGAGGRSVKRNLKGARLCRKSSLIPFAKVVKQKKKPNLRTWRMPAPGGACRGVHHHLDLRFTSTGVKFGIRKRGRIHPRRIRVLKANRFNRRRAKKAWCFFGAPFWYAIDCWPTPKICIPIYSLDLYTYIIDFMSLRG